MRRKLTSHTLLKEASEFNGGGSQHFGYREKIYVLKEGRSVRLGEERKNKDASGMTEFTPVHNGEEGRFKARRERRYSYHQKSRYFLSYALVRKKNCWDFLLRNPPSKGRNRCIFPSYCYYRSPENRCMLIFNTLVDNSLGSILP